jgi:hypothetical protein
MANTDLIKTKYYHSIKPKNLSKGLIELIENYLWYILDHNSSCSHQNVITNPHLLDSSWDFLYEWILKKLISVDHFKVNTSSNASCEADINAITNLNDSYCYFFHDSNRISLIAQFIKHVRNGFAHGAFNDENWTVLCDYNRNQFMGCFIKLNKTDDYDDKTRNFELLPVLNNIFIEIMSYKPLQLLERNIDSEINIIEDSNYILEYYKNNQKYKTIIISKHPLTTSKERSITNIKEFIGSTSKEYLTRFSKDTKFIFVLPFFLNATFSSLNEENSDYLILTKYLFHDLLDNNMNPDIFEK